MATTEDRRTVTTRARAGLRRLPSNAAWAASKVLRPAAGAKEGVQRRARDVVGAVADAVPVGPDSLELKLDDARRAVDAARQAEHDALEQATSAQHVADEAARTESAARERVDAAEQAARKEVEQRTDRARRQADEAIEAERRSAQQDADDQVDRVRRDAEEDVDRARARAHDAAQSAQREIDAAHEQMSAARASADQAAAAAEQAAKEAHDHAASLTDQARSVAGDAEDDVARARSVQTDLSREAADALVEEQHADVPAGLGEMTRRELLDLAASLDVPGRSGKNKAELVSAIGAARRRHAGGGKGK